MKNWLLALLIVVSVYSAPMHVGAAPADQAMMCDDYTLLAGSAVNTNVVEMGLAGAENHYTHYTLISTNGNPTVILEYGDPTGTGPGTYAWYPEATVAGNGRMALGYDQEPQYYNYLHRIRFSTEDTYPPMRTATVRACYEMTISPTAAGPTSTQDPTNTRSPTNAPTNTSVPTDTNTPTSTSTPTRTSTPTNVPTNTSTSTPANTSTATRTRTPTTTPDNNGCRTIVVSGSLMTNLTVGTVITATGTVEYGGQYGTSWQTIPGSGGILISATSSYYLRGTGTVYACQPLPTATPTVTPTPSGCYRYTTTATTSAWYQLTSWSPLTPYNLDPYSLPGTAYIGWTLRHVSGTVAMRAMPWNAENTLGLLNPGGTLVVTWSANWRVGSHIWAEGYGPTIFDFCPPATATATGTPPTATAPTVTRTPTGTRTSVATRTPGAPTATGLPTATNYPTPPVGLCVQTTISVGETVSLSVASGAYLRTLNGVAVAQGDQANYNVGTGGLIWPEADGSYAFTGISISDGGAAVIIEICPVGGEPSTPTTAPQATSTPGGAGSGIPPTALSGMPGYVPPISPPSANLSPLPDLQIQLPTLRPRPATATVVIHSADVTITIVLGGVSTIESGMKTPQAALSTAAAGYSYSSGVATGQEFGIMMQPALGWVAVLNPRHPGWSTRCGPLYALAPVVLPLLPIIIVSLVLSLLRFFIWVGGWILRIIDVAFKILQLIRG